MEYGQIPGFDRPVSRLVQGTIPLNEHDIQGSLSLLDGVFAEGCTTFDTARTYGGNREAIFGEWVRTRGNRDQLVVIGKGAHHSAERRRVTPADITEDLEESLRQFGFDHVDLYMLHRDDPSVPVGPIVAALDAHRKSGKIAAYGGSNWSHERIAEANAYAAANGHSPFTISSPNFSLATWVEPPWAECVSISGADGKPGREWYTANQIPVIPWSSLSGGFFSGRFRRDNLASFTEYLDVTCVKAYGKEENFERIDHAEVLGARYGRTLAQIALAYVLSTTMNVFPLVGCRTPAEFAENAAAVATRLSPAEVAWLDLETDEAP